MPTQLGNSPGAGGGRGGIKRSCGGEQGLLRVGGERGRCRGVSGGEGAVGFVQTKLFEEKGGGLGGPWRGRVETQRCCLVLCGLSGPLAPLGRRGWAGAAGLPPPQSPGEGWAGAGEGAAGRSAPLFYGCGYSLCSRFLAAAKAGKEISACLCSTVQGNSSPLLPLAPWPSPTLPKCPDPMGMGCPGPPQAPQCSWVNPALELAWRCRAFPGAGDGSGC